VEFSERPKAYLDFLQELLELQESQSNRRETRFEKILKVMFDRPEDLLEQYTQNISLGGLFVVTEAPPSLNSMAEIHIMLPEIMKVVHAEVRVVHLIDRLTAERFGMNPGVGVQFIRFFEDDETLLKSYIEEIKNKAQGK